MLRIPLPEYAAGTPNVDLTRQTLGCVALFGTLGLRPSPDGQLRVASRKLLVEIS